MTRSSSAETRPALRPLIIFCWIVCLVALPLSAAHAQVVALHADFNHDTVGEMPTTDLPGDPDGDSLVRSESGGTVRVQEAFGDMNGQPCVVTREIFARPIYVSGRVDPDLRDCSWYRVTWRGLVSANVQFFYMSFGSSNSQILASLEYRAGGVHTVNGSGNVISVGYQPNVSQFFDMELDLTTKTLNLSIDGQPVPEAQDLRFVQMGPDGLRSITTSFGMGDFYAVAIDDLHVLADGCPGVPTEEKPWGTIKALYR